MNTDKQFIDDFYSSYNKRMGKEYCQPKCKTCFSKYHAKNQRNNDLQYNHGINEAQYNQILKSQNSVCAICGQPETTIKHNKTQALAVDHNHKMGKVRGLLCHRCNRALGYFNDNPFLLVKAIKYLQLTK